MTVVSTRYIHDVIFNVVNAMMLESFD